MKLLRIFYIGDNKNDLVNLIEKLTLNKSRFRNRLIRDYHKKINDNRVLAYFSSKFKNKLEEIEIEFVKIDLCVNNDYFICLLSKLLDKAYNEASSLSKEPMSLCNEWEIPKTKETIISKIINKFNFYYMLENNNELSPDLEKEKSIIDLVSSIFCEIILSHVLTNGNKRLSIAVAINLLYLFGYYLKFTKSVSQDWNKYSYSFAKIIEKYHNTKNRSSMEKECKKIFLNNIVIALSFNTRI